MRKKSNLYLIIFIFFWWLILPIYLLKILYKYLSNKYKKRNLNQSDIIYECEYDLPKVSDNIYTSKCLVTDNEKYFLNIIEDYFGHNFRIIPQVPLSSIITKHKEFNNQYQNELYRTIDIGIFNKETFKPLLMIEINDKTHVQYDRHKRDLKVRDILKSANIPILTFYTNMPNKKDYVINRINDNLN